MRLRRVHRSFATLQDDKVRKVLRTYALDPRSQHSRGSYERGDVAAYMKTAITTWPAWLSALLPSVAFAPRRSSGGLPCSGLRLSRTYSLQHAESVQRFPYAFRLFLKTGVLMRKEVTTLFRFVIYYPLISQG